MAGLKVFVSSTCVDLGAQRLQVRALLERMGYEPVMSEHSDVLFDHRMHTHTSCIREIANADMVILLIGSRFGGTAVPEALIDLNLDDLSKSSSKTDLIKEADKLSITQVEVLKAIESEIPLFAFVDSKVYSDHHVYTKNKNKPFSDQISYPSIEKQETAKYIFEFISFVTHRFSNNAITAYSSFSDIEDFLTKQWSMTFQRLLREERDKSLEGRRADALLEQIQDLKAVVLQSINVDSGRELAKNVLKYRRLAEFLMAMKSFNSNVNLPDFRGNFDDLLAKFGVAGVHPSSKSRGILPTTILQRDDGSYFRVRVPAQRFSQFSAEWDTFSKLNKETKAAVLSGVEDSESVTPPMVTSISDLQVENSDSLITFTLDTMLNKDKITPFVWTNDKVDSLRKYWEKGLSASRIAKELGTSTNVVAGKAYRLGLLARPGPGESE